MSAKQKRLLHAILIDPPSGNIQWREIEALLSHLGAKIESIHGARMHIILNNIETTLHKPHNSNTCNKRDMHLLRDYLIQAGISTSAMD